MSGRGADEGLEPDQIVVEAQEGRAGRRRRPRAGEARPGGKELARGEAQVGRGLSRSSGRRRRSGEREPERGESGGGELASEGPREEACFLILCGLDRTLYHHFSHSVGNTA